MDTIPAGDYYFAALITMLLSDGDPQQALDFASVEGAIEANNPGANPKLKPAAIAEFLTKDASIIIFNKKDCLKQSFLLNILEIIFIG
ncbi:hypothetical protein [Sphingobacterium sp. DR205]|uniref:hypothetical protein n=1 Tax=Sphingobacterium sp. DR205 TaxID=2713573 RepID=UPI0013E4A635|nr:hypothetical protein [Sphingobacterium sp. DR205]QIH34583.1 hypothetical protein G6053_17525 [Sphingobacterium sp. DR205]